MENNTSVWGILSKTVVPIRLHPNFESEMADEGLYGMVVKIVENVEENWYLVQTHYNYKGYIHESDMIIDDEKSEEWKNIAKGMIIHSVVDAMSKPAYQGYIVQVLTKGARVMATGKVEKEWSEIQLADGKKGWVKSIYLGSLKETHNKKEEGGIRKALVETAFEYMDTQYRWGGKSPLGIDCSGLCSISYLMNGIIIYRDAVLKEEYMREISLEEIKPGDLLFFPGHVAMYIGDDKYIHSSSSNSGVKINSLNPNHSDYKEDLAKTITGIGTIF